MSDAGSSGKDAVDRSDPAPDGPIASNSRGPRPCGPASAGWAEAYRARVCGTSGQTTTIDMRVRDVALRDAGVRLERRAPVAVAWAMDIFLPKDVTPVGITVAFDQGTLLLTSDGRWLRIAPPNAPIVGGLVEAHAIGDGTRPKAVSSESDGTVATIQQDGSTIARYDSGYAATWPVSGGDVARPFEEPYVRVSDHETLTLLAGFDIAGGCDAVAGMRDAKGRTTLARSASRGSRIAL